MGVRVTEAEAEELQERAQGARLSVGAYLRRRGLGQRVRMAAERSLGRGGAAGAEPDRGESQSNGAGDELRRGGPRPGTREEVERVGELVARLLAGEAK